MCDLCLQSQLIEGLGRKTSLVEGLSELDSEFQPNLGYRVSL